MANEITITTALTIQNGYLSKDMKVSALKVNQNTLDADDDVHTITTSDAAITLDVATLGYIHVRNLDTTNFVKLGPESGGAIIPMVKLKAGESALLRLMTGITLRGQADTASCKVRIMALND